MQLYEAKIRLGGSVQNEVRKSELTAPEIVVLRQIHGNDAVLEIKSMGREALDPTEDHPTALRTSKRERERLEMLYAGALKTIESIKHLNGIFGVGLALPDTLEGVAHVAQPEAEKPVRRRVVKPEDVTPAPVAAPAPEDELV